MKNLKILALALLLALGTTATIAQNKKIKVDKSKINWVGKKVTGKHSGTINFSEGILVFKNKKVKGGNFTVDMSSIEVTDLQAGKGKEKLEGHLKADDFFGTTQHQKAKLVFKTISKNKNNTYNVTADLTIKEVTAPVSFVLNVKGNTATTTFNVDRTKYGIKYGSGSFYDNLGDKAIADEFELAVNLQF